MATHILSVEDLAQVAKLPTRTIRRYARMGWFRGLRRGGWYDPSALAVAEMLTEVAVLWYKGDLTEDEARATSFALRSKVLEAWALARAGRPHSLDVSLSTGKSLSFAGTIRAAEAFERFTAARRNGSSADTSKSLSASRVELRSTRSRHPPDERIGPSGRAVPKHSAEDIRALSREGLCH